MRADHSQLLVRPALALLLSALAGCSVESTGGFVPTPVRRTTAVTVQDALGAPVASATVFALRLDVLGTVEAEPTDAFGIARFSLAVGRWAVSTRLGGGTRPAQVAGSTGTITLSGNGVPDTVLFRLQLVTESFASGHCTLAGRSDPTGTVVSALELPALASTDGAGAWTLGGLPPGVWTGTAAHVGYAPAVFDLVVPAPGDTLALPPIVLQPGGAPATAFTRPSDQRHR